MVTRIWTAWLFTSIAKAFDKINKELNINMNYHSIIIDISLLILLSVADHRCYRL